MALMIKFSLLLPLLGCAPNPLSVEEEPSAKISVLFPGQTSRSIINTVDYYMVRNGSRTVRRSGNLLIEGRTAKATLRQIESGETWVFYATAYDVHGVRTFLGEGSVKVRKGKISKLSIPMNRRYGTLSIYGDVPKESTHIRLTIHVPDFEEPIVITEIAEHRSLLNRHTPSYHIRNIPTGGEILVDILAYTNSTRNPTFRDSRLVDVKW